jgi:hypothetical protein
LAAALVCASILAASCGDRVPTVAETTLPARGAPDSVQIARDLAIAPVTTTTSLPVTHPPVSPAARQPVPRPLRLTGGAPATITDEQLRRLRNCESGGRYGIRNPPYSGAYQFTAGTWRSMGTGYLSAADAPSEVQDDAARRLYARSGRGQWPICGRAAGLA